jgi:nucleotide-binding universal stress UspA family protein
VAERLVRTSPVPVLTTGPVELVKGGGLAAFRHVLVPTDFGEPAERAVAIASALATTFDAKLTLVHAYAMPTTLYDESTRWPTAEIMRDAEIALKSALEKTRERFPAVESVLVRGDPREGILEVARERNADLIVMGTHGRRGLSRAFLGSVAERVVRTSPIPVLTVGAHAKASDAKR